VSALKVAMKNDYQLTQKCNMIIAAVLPIAQPAGFVLKKGSPHLEIFNRGLLLAFINLSTIFSIYRLNYQKI
jgi:hypothetical protein